MTIKSYALTVIILLVVLSISALCVKQKKALSLADVDLVYTIICIKRMVSHLCQRLEICQLIDLGINIDTTTDFWMKMCEWTYSLKKRTWLKY